MNDESPDPHIPPHGRFFEDGEEPPDRYDLYDDVDYLVPGGHVFDEGRWWALAWWGFKTQPWRFVARTILPLLIGVVACLMTCGFGFVLLQPILRFYLVDLCMGVLTARPQRFNDTFPSERIAGRLIACQIILALCWLPTIIVPSFMVSVFLANSAPELAQAAFYSSTGLLAGLSAYFHVRLCGFAFELVYDHDISADLALRGSWRMTGPYGGRFVWLKLRLWALTALVGVATLGLGLLLVIPYTRLIWTAAYLDIAGSEPVKDSTDPKAE